MFKYLNDVAFPEGTEINVSDFDFSESDIYVDLDGLQNLRFVGVASMNGMLISTYEDENGNDHTIKAEHSAYGLWKCLGGAFCKHKDKNGDFVYCEDSIKRTALIISE